MSEHPKESIVIASDHGGFSLKEYLKSELSAHYKFVDVGCHSVESVDYPDFVKKAIDAMRAEKIARGMVLCGTGVGTSIASNKFKGIRAALCVNEYTARMSRKHNDSNVLCMGQRVVGEQLALEIAKVWLETEFEGGRHVKRLKKIEEVDS